MEPVNTEIKPKTLLPRNKKKIDLLYKHKDLKQKDNLMVILIFEKYQCGK